MIQFSAAAQTDRRERQSLSAAEERQEAILNKPAAQQWDKKVEAVTGAGHEKEQIYSLAADLLQMITLEAKGNPEKMQEILLEAQSNPQAFYRKYFNKDQKAKLRNLASEIEKKQDSPGPASK